MTIQLNEEIHKAAQGLLENLGGINRQLRNWWLIHKVWSKLELLESSFACWLWLSQWSWQKSLILELHLSLLFQVSIPIWKWAGENLTFLVLNINYHGTKTIQAFEASKGLAVNGPLPNYVNKVVCITAHAHSFTYCLWQISLCRERAV